MTEKLEKQMRKIAEAEAAESRERKVKDEPVEEEEFQDWHSCPPSPASGPVEPAAKRTQAVEPRSASAFRSGRRLHSPPSEVIDSFVNAPKP